MHIKPQISVQRASGDLAIAKLADRQQGVVSYWQLRALGYTRHQIQRRIETGHLHVIHRGVYAVGRRNWPSAGGGWRQCSRAARAPC